MTEPTYVRKGDRYYAEYSYGFVYFASTDERPCIFKIGWSQTPEYRVPQLKYMFGGSTPKIRRLVCVDRGSRLFGTGKRSLEKTVHSWLRNRSLGGEMFKLTPKEALTIAAWAIELVEMVEEDDLAQAG